jgi:hypothetical protein
MYITDRHLLAATNTPRAMGSWSDLQALWVLGGRADVESHLVWAAYAVACPSQAVRTARLRRGHVRSMTWRTAKRKQHTRNSADNGNSDNDSLQALCLW